MNVDELTHVDVVRLARGKGLPLDHGDSFWGSIVARRRKKQLGPVAEKWLGLSKVHDEGFAQAVGVPVVDALMTGPWDMIDREALNVVVKPVKGSGSKGAFYILPDGIVSIKSGKRVADWNEAARVAEDQLGWPIANTEWQVQSPVTRNGQPAVDMKFYVFYGEIGLIQEVSRHPRVQYEYFNEDFTIAPCGREHEPRFSDPSQTTVDKGGLDEAKLEQVRELSRSIPAPFMRIDYLNGDEALVFCELSSAPGMSNTLSPEYDQRLGRLYLEAEVRLSHDLVQGKEFTQYQDFAQRVRSERARRARDAAQATKPTPVMEKASDFGAGGAPSSTVRKWCR